MSLSLTFNELSFQSPAENIATARERLGGFVDILLQLRRAGVRQPVRGVAELYTYPLAPDYPLSDWLNDREVERERRTYLRSQLTSAPRLREEELGSGEGDGGIWEFRYGKQIALGLGFAYLADGLSISVLFQGEWNSPTLSVNVSRLSEDAALDEFVADVKHAVSAAHIDSHRRWIEEKEQAAPVASWAELLVWARGNCEHLLIADYAFDELHDKQFVPAIANRAQELLLILNRLNRAIIEEDEETRREIDDLYFRRKNAPFTDESETNKTQKKQVLTFRHPETDEDILCSWHGKIRHKAYRLHFFWPKPTQDALIVVVYLGPHLT